MTFATTLWFDYLWLALVGLSFCICCLIIFFASQYTLLRGRKQDLGAVQAMHTRATPRLGGVAIFSAIGLILQLGPTDGSPRFLLFFLGTSIVFLVGLKEDLGFHVSPAMRLFAVVASSFFVIILMGEWIPRTGIMGIGDLAKYWFVGIPLTLLVTAGISNGFNLIDGVNGLAALAGITSAVAMAQICVAAEYLSVGMFSYMLAAAILGFAILNFPFGFIFLGDAGAYTVGFVLSWFGVSLLTNSTAASPWALVLVFFWPIADTMLAIYRRQRRKALVSAPDRLHSHQMVMRAIEICWVGRSRRHISNPLTTVVLAPFIIAPPTAGVLLWNQNLLAFIALVCFGVLFFVGYASLPRFIRRFRR